MLKGEKSGVVRSKFDDGNVKQEECQQRAEVGQKYVEDRGQGAEKEQQSPDAANGERTTKPAKSVESAVGETNNQKTDTAEPENHRSEDENGTRVHLDFLCYFCAVEMADCVGTILTEGSRNHNCGAMKSCVQRDFV